MANATETTKMMIERMADEGGGTERNAMPLSATRIQGEKMRTNGLGEKIHGTLHEQKEHFAGRLDEMGNQIEENTERLRDVAGKAALRLHEGAEKMRETHSVDACRQLLNRYPVGSMVGAMFLGMALGRAMRR